MIEGVALVPLKEIRDERGAVLQMLRADAPEFSGFGECYFSEVNPGKVKAWKRHCKQTQSLAVPVGRIRLVIFDSRAGSPTHGELLNLELGRPDAYTLVRIPPGVWYGFQCLGDSPALLANCADLSHDPAESETRPLDSNKIPFRW